MKKFIPITNYINLGGKLDLLDPLNEVLFAKPSDKNHHQRVVKVELENHSVPTYTVHFENGDKGDYPENCLEVQVNMMLDTKYLGRPPLAEFTNKLHSLGYVGTTVADSTAYFEYNWKEISTVVPAMVQKYPDKLLNLTKEIKEHFKCSLIQAKSIADFYIR